MTERQVLFLCFFGALVAFAKWHLLDDLRVVQYLYYVLAILLSLRQLLAQAE